MFTGVHGSEREHLRRLRTFWGVLGRFKVVFIVQAHNPSKTCLYTAIIRYRLIKPYK